MLWPWASAVLQGQVPSPGARARAGAGRLPARWAHHQPACGSRSRVGSRAPAAVVAPVGRVWVQGFGGVVTWE